MRKINRFVLAVILGRQCNFQRLCRQEAITKFFRTLIFRFSEILVIPALIVSSVCADELSEIGSLEDLLRALHKASQTHSFNSVVAYEANGHTSTYRLEHHVDDDNIVEKMFFQTGLPKKIVRQQNFDACSSVKAPKIASAAPPSKKVQALDTYRLETAGIDRVAGREALVFHVVPKDDYRYAYRFSLDKELGLLLKVITLENKRIVERLQVVTLEELTSHLGQATASNPRTNSGETNENEDEMPIWRAPMADLCQVKAFESRWHVGWLPPGFRSVGSRLTAQGEQTLVFSDGLASISVFVNNQTTTENKISARHGATVLAMTSVPSLSNKTISVVGEIPVQTARKIAVSVRGKR